ncbi:MAG: diguanylate cyclase [Deltaproteobacteria bacterium]|nr:diguanylate cyclase [Deltaproteobacteria bacterium]
MRSEQLLSASTNLFKRKMLDVFLGAEYARSVRTGRPFALVLAGVDRAQALDQIAGDEARARVVGVVAKAIDKHKRAFDLMGHFSPTEVFVVLPDNDGDGARGFAERIRRELGGSKIALPNFEYRVSLSFGYAFFHPVNNLYRDRNELLTQAEAALFAAASSGGNRIVAAARPPTRSPSNSKS